MYRDVYVMCHSGLASLNRLLTKSTKTFLFIDSIQFIYITLLFADFDFDIRMV